MADSRGRPIIRPKDVEEERMKKRMEWLASASQKKKSDSQSSSAVAAAATAQMLQQQQLLQVLAMNAADPASAAAMAAVAMQASTLQATLAAETPKEDTEEDGDRKDEKRDRKEKKDRRSRSRSRDRHDDRDRKKKDRKERDKDKDRDRDRDKDKEKSRDRRSRSGSRDKKKERDRKDRDRDRDRDRDGDRDRDRRDRDRKERRDRDRDRRGSSRDRSRDRDRHKSSRRRHRSPSSSSDSEDYGGYCPRERKRDYRRPATPPPGVGVSITEPFSLNKIAANAPAISQLHGAVLGAGPSAVAQLQQAAAAGPQTSEEQMLRARAWILQKQAENAASLLGSKKYREIYVGNLSANGVTVVTPDVLTKLFNSAMEAALPNSGIDANNPPVINVAMSPDGKYAFVELRTDEMATAALGLNKLELMGRELHIARPSGYVDPSTMASLAASATAEADGAAGAPPEAGSPLPAPAQSPTSILILTNMFEVEVLSDPQEYSEIVQDIEEECGRFGEVREVLLPKAGTAHAGKAYVVFSDMYVTQTAFQVMHGRHFAGNQISCGYCTPEELEQVKAQQPQ